jgi:hypothetical protein
LALFNFFSTGLINVLLDISSHELTQDLGGWPVLSAADFQKAVAENTFDADSNSHILHHEGSVAVGYTFVEVQNASGPQDMSCSASSKSLENPIVPCSRST